VSQARHHASNQNPASSDWTSELFATVAAVDLNCRSDTTKTNQSKSPSDRATETVSLRRRILGRCDNQTATLRFWCGQLLSAAAMSLGNLRESWARGRFTGREYCFRVQIQDFRMACSWIQLSRRRESSEGWGWRMAKNKQITPVISV